MRKRILAVIVMIFSFSLALAQNETGQAQTAQQDACAGITCSPSQITCADGFAASCANACSSGSCSQCTPSCAGHETTPAPQPVQQPVTASQPASQNTSQPTDSGPAQQPIITSQPVPEPPTAPRPAQPPSVNETVKQGCPDYARPSCSTDQQLESRFNAEGCQIYVCAPSNYQPCAEAMTPATDASGRCMEFKNSCLPPGWNKVDRCPEKRSVCGNNICEEGEAGVQGGCSGNDPRCLGPPATTGTCQQDCQPQRREFCGNGMCEKGEENYCQQDCISARPSCPVVRTCGNGQQVSCRQEKDCSCEPCPLEKQSVPEGCRQEVDKERGFLRVVCESKPACPQNFNIEEKRTMCERGNGMFSMIRSHDGCEFPECRFAEGNGSNPFVGYKKCESESETQVESTRKACESLGLRHVVSFEGGCRVSRCSSVPVNACPDQSQSRQQTEKECSSRGMSITKDFQNGCPVFRCSEQQVCGRDVPKEAYEKCSSTGGEVVIKRDNQDCVVFSECIQRGNVRNTYVEPVKEVPESTELLSIAFKMEQLKIELEKLASQTDDIADYYKSVNSPDEGRFRRVSDTFLSARDKVNEIKAKLRDKLNSLSKGDMEWIRSDMRYIKDVMLKDAVYLMLSTSEDVRKIGTKESEDCGTNGECFDRAFRLCKKVTFMPEGSRGPTIGITGLEDKNCILKAVIPEGEGPPPGAIPGINPPYEMTCKVPNYSLGIKGPEDILPYCQGNMVELVKKYGTGENGKDLEQAPSECIKDGKFIGRDECEKIMSSKFRHESSGESSGTFSNQYGETRPQPPLQPQERLEQGSCRGCFDNNVCDPGECSSCRDCSR